MKTKSIIMAAVTLLCLSCSKQVENPDSEPTATVSVHVSDFTVALSDLSGAGTRATEAPADYDFVGELVLAFYDADGKEVYKTSQSKSSTATDANFGEFSFQLPVGNYTMVAIGRDVGNNDAFSLTSPVQAAYTSERVRETFSAVQPVVIASTAAVSLNVTLNRVVTKLVVESTDNQPAGVAKIRTTYGAGSKGFNPTSGLALDNMGFTLTNSVNANPGTTLAIKNFAFLAADEQEIDITLEVLDEKGGVLSKRVIPNVPFRRNRQTTLRGQLFSSKGTNTFHLETTWLPGFEVNF
ncbi:MAG: FimB/Mfa2 family fimbrial subunit [Prevotella sp.]|nr:FimB/Mfa2 family fimbrial subunit [Prevotella sp.]